MALKISPSVVCILVVMTYSQGQMSLAGVYHDGAHYGGAHHAEVHHDGTHHAQEKVAGVIDGSHGADIYATPNYRYQYGVQTPQTGDFKMQKEERVGDALKGEYALREPDGSIRHVVYIADHNGFRAKVHRTPAGHPVGKAHGHGH